MQNTWRLPKADKDPGGILKVKLNEVLWQTNKELVFTEIASLLGIPSADSNTPGWIGKRLKALQNVYARMNPEEKAALKMHRNRIKREGHPEDLRRKYVRQWCRVPCAVCRVPCAIGKC
jgi:hypothetical protein